MRISQIVSRSTSLAVASSLVISSILTPSAILAATAPQVANPGGNPPVVDVRPGTVDPAAKPVEVLSKRAENAKHFKMPDGTMRAEIHAAPIHFKDESGSWMPFDNTLEPTGIPGESKNSAGPFDARFRNGTPGVKPVTFSRDGWSVSMDLAGGNEGQHTDLGNKAHYASVVPATDIDYEVADSGLKETLTLQSPAAPSSFTFHVTLSGIELKDMGNGVWALLRPGKLEPVMYLGGLSVWDASGDAETGPFAEDTSITVTPTSDGAFITYAVPRSWLDDPSRAFPVKVDPSFTSSIDGYIDQTYTSNSFGTQTTMKAGRTGANKLQYSMFQFDLSSVPTYSYVYAATARVHKDGAGSTGTFTENLNNCTSAWSESTSWNTRPTQAFLASQTVDASSGWVDWDVRGTVSSWVNGSATNYGFQIQPSTSTTNVVHAFYTHEYTTDTTKRPTLVVDYWDSSAAANVTQSLTDTSSTAYTYASDDTSEVVEVINLANTWPEDVQEVRIIPNYNRGIAAERGGYMAWFRDKALIPGGWATFASPYGGWFAYTQDQFGSEKITPLLHRCYVTPDSQPGTKSIEFHYRIKDNWGDVQANTPDYYVAMGKGASTWETPWRTGEATFSVVPSPVSMNCDAGKSDETPGTWWTEPSAGANNDTTSGRGSMRLEWKPLSSATGYKVYLHDGNAWQQVGRTFSSTATTWTSAGAGMLPKDSGIASWSNGYTGNPFARGSSPSLANQDDSFSPTATAGDGVIATDGTYLYVRAWSNYVGPTTWTKIGSGFGGTTKGTNYGTVGPDFASKTILSGFYSGGYLYNGYADSATTLTRVNASTGATSTFTFSSALLNRSTGNSLTGASGGILLTADSSNIYSIAQSIGTGNYDGWRVKKYDLSGTYVGTYSIPAPSYYTDGVLVDANNMYFIEWTGTDAARVTKVRKADWSITNQWTIDQGAKRVIQGCYDTTNNVFWLGKLDASGIYRYRGLGFELRDDPSRLYAKMGSGSRANDTHYRFKVIPVNGADSSNFTPTSSYGAMSTDYYTTLPNRTYGVNDDPRHAEASLGEAAKHDMSAWLDNSTLHASMTDLSIASWGPDASLSRTYDSGNTTANYFAAGWRFNFEQSVTATGSDMLYTDEDGISHKFRYSGGAYVAPRGFHATLAGGTEWTLDFPAEDRTLKFDSMTGKLKSETDDNGNTTTYGWTGDDLIITASNEQTIAVDVIGGKVTSATYSTSAGSREVTYSVSGTPTVTYFPNTSAAYSVQYGYDAGNRLTELYVPSSTFEATGNVAARWKFLYTSGAFTEQQLPGYDAATNPAKTTIGYLGSSATLTRPTSASTSTVETYAWDATNKTITSHGLPKYTTDSATPTEYYAYGPGNETVKNTSPLGFQSRTAIDARGLTMAEVDQVGLVTTSSYDSSLRLSSTTDPRGSTTSYTYNGSTSDVAQETKVLDAAGTTAGTKYTYDSAGRTLTEQKLINDGTTWVTTASYGTFAGNGESQETSIPSVTIDASSSPVTITTGKVIDEFGNVTSETDASGTVTVRNDYDIAGRAVTSTDAAGAVSQALYDVLGNEIETSSTAGAAFTGWTRKTVDPLGRALEDSVLSAADVADNYTTHTFDALGRETITIGSIEGTSTNTFDARGNTLTATGADGTTTTNEYDLDGRTSETWNAGETTPTVTAYDAAGRATYVTNPDGTFASTVFNHKGDKVYETAPADDSGTTSTTSLTAFDLGGRAAYSVKDALGRGYSATVSSYDRLDRKLTAGLGQNVASSMTYNTIGWTLAETDADGVVAASAYDKTGRKGLESICGNVTRHTFDTSGRTTRQDNPDGSYLTYAYDAFGRTTNETHNTAAGEIRNIMTSFDALGRVSSSTDNQTGVWHGFVYPTGATKAGTETVTYSTGTTVTIAFDAFGRETARNATAVGGTQHSITDIVRDSANRATTWKVYTNQQTAAFDGAGKLTNQGGFGFASGSGATYTADPTTGRKVSDSIGLSAGSGTGSYSYTTDGRLANANITGGVSTDYSYDAAGNLVTVKPSGSDTTTLSYDPTGNQLQSKTTSGASKLYGFDALGRRIYQGPSSDTSETVYGWDASSHLVSYDTSSGLHATFEYDARGQRTKSVVTQGSTTTTTTFVYEGLILLSLSAESKASGSATETWSFDYLYNESSRPVGGFYRTSGGAAQRFYLITNDRGDIVEIISGSNTTMYLYDAWGTPITIPSDTIASRQPLRYAGYYWDASTAMYYCSARYYDPWTWQWISKDPAKADGEESAYQYARGNPVGEVDPTGCYSLSVPTVHQYDSSGKNLNLCWAASCVAVIRYLWGGGQTNELTVQDFAKLANDTCIRSEDKNSGSYANFMYALSRYKITSNHISRPLRWKEIVRQLSVVKKPVLCQLDYNGSRYGHWVVLCGYNVKRGVERVEYMNPLRKGGKEFCNVDFFKNNTNKNWKWVGSVFASKS